MNLNPIRAARELLQDWRDLGKISESNKEINRRIGHNLSILITEVSAAVTLIAAVVFVARVKDEVEIFTIIEQRLEFLANVEGHLKICEPFNIIKLIASLRKSASSGLFVHKEKVEELLMFLDSEKDAYWVKYLIFVKDAKNFSLMSITKSPHDEVETGIARWSALTKLPQYDTASASIIVSCDELDPDLTYEYMLHMLIAISDARSHKEKGTVDYSDTSWIRGFDWYASEKEGDLPSQKLFAALMGSAMKFLTSAIEFSKKGDINDPHMLLRIFDYVLETDTDEAKTKQVYRMVRLLLISDQMIHESELPEDDPNFNTIKLVQVIRPSLIEIAKNPSLISDYFGLK